MPRTTLTTIRLIGLEYDKRTRYTREHIWRADAPKSWQVSREVTLKGEEEIDARQLDLRMTQRVIWSSHRVLLSATVYESPG